VDFRDRTGTPRIAGSQWHYDKEGVFIPAVNERILSVDKAIILTDKVALHLRAQHRFTDAYGINRPSGTEWLITNDITTSHIPHVFETVVGTVQITTVNKRQWVIIQNPIEEGRPQYGKKKILRGEKNIFLQPGEKLLQTGSVYVLTADKAILLQAVKPFDERTALGTIHRKAGEKWLLTGPVEYWPPLEVSVLNENVSAIIQIGSTSIFQLETLLYMTFGVLLTLIIIWRLISALF